MERMIVMRNNKKRIYLTTLLWVLMLVLIGCTKEDPLDYAPDQIDNPDAPNVAAERQGDDFTTEERVVIEEKVENLTSKEHYDGNVEQLGREKHYNRTSYYDKPIGRLVSKKVHIDEIIYAGASELNMRRGVATVEYLEPLDEHTVAIAGHRSRNPKQYLTGALYLVNGDVVTVNMYEEGTEKVIASTDYVVEKTFKVDPSDVYVLEDDKKRKERKLVLVTCASYNPETGKYEERWIAEAYKKS